MRLTNKEKPRDELLGVKMTEAELKLLDDIAFHYNANRSELIRFFIAKEAADLGLTIPDRLKYETT